MSQPTQSEQAYSIPNGLAAYTMTLLHNHDEYLLLQRAPTKRLHPDLWTGVGGRVENHEYADLTTAALRELKEETGINAAQVDNYHLRRAVIHARPGGPFTLLCCFTGDLQTRIYPNTDEGTLSWQAAESFANLPFIDNMGITIPLLVNDMQREPRQVEALSIGVALYEPNGDFRGIVWT